ncbi:MAG: ArsR family transcriptional regulator [Bacteroidetes bacterium]|nr:ArsR family transcriptional regulator [Bacteroidota bacterium]
MIKAENIEKEIQDITMFTKAISHPAQLAIPKNILDTKTCISDNTSNYLPHNRSTISQHTYSLKELDLVHRLIDGLKMNYCLYLSIILKYENMVNSFFKEIGSTVVVCSIDGK